MQTINEDIKNGTFKPVYLLVHIQPFSLEIIVIHRIIARDRRPQLLFMGLQ